VGTVYFLMMPTMWRGTENIFAGNFRVKRLFSGLSAPLTKIFYHARKIRMAQLGRSRG